MFAIDDGHAQPAGGDEKAAIETVIRSQAEAWNRGDANAFAANYAEDGSFTNILGMQAYGRPAFIKQHARIFSTIYKGSHTSLAIGKIKFLRPDVAVVDIDGVLKDAKELPPGMKAADDGALHVKLQEVMTKESSGWTIASYHNIAVQPRPPVR